MNRYIVQCNTNDNTQKQKEHLDRMHHKTNTNSTTLTCSPMYTLCSYHRTADLQVLGSRAGKQFSFIMINTVKPVYFACPLFCDSRAWQVRENNRLRNFECSSVSV